MDARKIVCCYVPNYTHSTQTPQRVGQAAKQASTEPRYYSMLDVFLLRLQSPVDVIGHLVHRGLKHLTAKMKLLAKLGESFPLIGKK